MTSPAPSPQPSPRASSQANPPADPRANPQDPPAPRSADPHRRPAPRGPSAPQPDRAPRATPAQTSRGTPVTFGSASWLVVLAAVALVQVTRHAWTDTAVLLGVLLVLVVDASGRLAHGAVRVASTGPVVIGVAVLAGLGAFVMGGLCFVGALLGAAPPLIIYAFLMDYYIAGLTAGATKG